MNIVRENREDQVAVIKVTVAEADYKEAVDKQLREFRRKANIPGFRPGMVPMALVNKMYRKGTVAETAYKTASNACFDFLEKEKIDFIGDVLPSEEQGSFDFDNNTDHEFVFEVGLAPEVDLELSDKDKLTRYKVKIADDMRSGYRSNFLRRYGRLVDVPEVKSDEAVIGTLDNGEIKVEEAYIGLISMTEEERKPYIGKKVGDEIIVNIEELYKKPSQRASVLGIKEHELAGVTPEFKFTVTQIRQFAEPELNEEFFQTAFPEGDVKDEKGLENYLEKQIEAELDKESDYVFSLELRKYLIEKAGLSMPEEFLKRWLVTVNEGKFTKEEIDRDFAPFLDLMRWNLIQKRLAEKLEIKVEQEDMMAEAKSYAAAQFAQYGMMNLQDEMLNNYANSIHGSKEEANKLFDRLYERKVIEAVTPLIKVSSKSVSVEEMGKIFEKLNK